MESGSRLFFNPYNSGMFSLANCDPAFPGSKPVLNMALDSSRKRPFFSSPEDCFEDEYYEDQLSEKKRRLTPAQVNLLEKSFEEENKLEPERKTKLADKLGLQPRQVAVWFQNRRARWKTKQLERDYDLLKASYDSLLSDYDSILTQHNKLKAQVAALSEKLQMKDAAVAKGPESFQLGTGQLTPGQLNPKVEDRLSSGTAASAVVDIDSQQLLDSGDSLIENTNSYSLYGITSRGIHSEDDEGCDNGRSYFSGVFVEAGRQHHKLEEPLEWWMWS